MIFYGQKIPEKAFPDVLFRGLAVMFVRKYISVSSELIMLQLVSQDNKNN